MKSSVFVRISRGIGNIGHKSCTTLIIVFTEFFNERLLLFNRKILNSNMA